MHKKNVPSVVHIPFNAMEKMPYTNKDSIVWNVRKLMSGKILTTASCTISTGSNCGSPRVALSNYFADCPGTVDSNSTVSRITGLNNFQRSISTTLRSITWSTMPPISIKMGVC